MDDIFGPPAGVSGSSGDAPRDPQEATLTLEEDSAPAFAVAADPFAADAAAASGGTTASSSVAAGGGGPAAEAVVAAGLSDGRSGGASDGGGVSLDDGTPGLDDFVPGGGGDDDDLDSFYKDAKDGRGRGGAHSDEGSSLARVCAPVAAWMAPCWSWTTTHARMMAQGTPWAVFLLLCGLTALGAGAIFVMSCIQLFAVEPATSQLWDAEPAALKGNGTMPLCQKLASEIILPQASMAPLRFWTAATDSKPSVLLSCPWPGSNSAIRIIASLVGAAVGPVLGIWGARRESKIMVWANTVMCAVMAIAFFVVMIDDSSAVGRSTGNCNAQVGTLLPAGGECEFAQFNITCFMDAGMVVLFAVAVFFSQRYVRLSMGRAHAAGVV